MYHHTLFLGILLFVGVGLVGCGLSGSNEEEDADVTGFYKATTFTLEIDSGSYNVLAEGGFLRMTLKDNGRVQGRLFVPCSLPGACEEDGEEALDVTFGGIYEVDGDAVIFDHRADTFIRNAEWTYRNNTLRTTYKDTDEEETVVLTRFTQPE